MTVDKALVVIDVQPIFMSDTEMLALGGDDLVTICTSLLNDDRSFNMWPRMTCPQARRMTL